MSNPAWLGRVAIGVLLVALGNTALYAGVLLVQIVNYGPIVFGSAQSSWTLLVGRRSVLPFIAATYVALSGAGFLFLSSDEGRCPERARGLRLSVFIAGIASIVLGIWWLIARGMGAFGPPRFLVVVVVHGVAALGLWYTAELARRVPSRKIERAIYLALCGLALSFAAVVLNSGSYYYAALFNPWSREIFLWTLLLLTYPPVAVAVHLYLMRAYRRAASSADENWNKTL
ncbi:MAG: hypothetical protein H0T11_09280 [Chthoniobacterales bacterium]|nr:hypothetical protein [Chthoniobacterales bacterium]